MRTTLLATVLAVAATASMPTLAARPDGASARPAVSDRYEMARQHDNIGSTQGRPDQAQFVGPFQLHDGLLPNGIMPNPPTYG
jgi:hypothetical protein